MRLRIPALLVLSLLLTPCAEAGLFGTGKKKLPKPLKLVHIRPQDAKRWASPTKLSAKYSPSWGRATQMIYAPQYLRLQHPVTEY